MLSSLSIQDLAIVDHLTLSFHSGMTVITGETGSGKSILLAALGLVLGDRADADSVRHGAKQAEIQAEFTYAQLTKDAQHWLQEKGYQDSQDQCWLRRVVSRSGRSRAWINGHTCTLSELKELGSHLLDLHSQHAHHRLLKPDNHRVLLDEFAHLEPQVEQIRHLYRHWQQLEQRHIRRQQQEAALAAQEQLLRYQWEELEQLALEANEIEQLEAEQYQLSQAESLIRAGEHALKLCDQENGGALQATHQALQTLEAHQDPRLDNVLKMLQEARIQLQESARELEHYVSTLELDPQRLHFVEQRLDQIYRIARKHQVAVQELPQLHARLSRDLQQLAQENQDSDILEQHIKAARAQYQQAAHQLSQARQQAGQALSTEVNQHLHILGMPNAHFEVQLQTSSATATGTDQLEFYIATNPGQPAKPLVRIASGGELSRISLAIQVVSTQTRRTPTWVFDEVDVGISGATAEIVGRLLQRLGHRGQVLCITHLPQVAALGDQHWRISKHVEQEETRTQVQVLDTQGRIQELGRLLGGIHVSDHTIAHAQALLATAQA
ncbi:DNA repair protein RecN (Recombination protein N) [Allopseudospirillum japonicum]|uniref:DNA repair protein RecN n=1 Tax=Allopseudospirillum japonicum TaxID=64971 RepID=A0A1H6R3V1_9GAMM|nr:DNA repair protein RecN [Allopseudospirillum japonicum]SEI47187.1 DNA repair protein RecN (Recombination protein N) [Allopseudospirillum japonicum]